MIKKIISVDVGYSDNVIGINKVMLWRIEIIEGHIKAFFGIESLRLRVLNRNGGKKGKDRVGSIEKIVSFSFLSF